MALLKDTLYPLDPPNRHRDPKRPMQVLCIGLSRSGTDSLRKALQILGYEDIYHGFVITSERRGDCAFWSPLLRRKIAGQSLGSPNFDSVLGPCDAITDAPAALFGEELMDFYPNAKVILNKRKNVDAWHKSMQQTVQEVFGWPMWTFSWFDRHIFRLWEMFHLSHQGFYGGDFDNKGKKVFHEHYDRMERYVDSHHRQALRWSVEDGWEPLCRFLGRDVPTVPFPSGNAGGGQFEDNMEEATKDMVLNAFKNMGILVVALGAIGVGGWYARRV